MSELGPNDVIFQPPQEVYVVQPIEALVKSLTTTKDLLRRIAFSNNKVQCDLCDVAEPVFGTKQCKLLECRTCPEVGCLPDCPIVKAVLEAEEVLKAAAQVPTLCTPEVKTPEVKK